MQKNKLAFIGGSGIYNLDIGDCLSFDSTLEHQALPIISGIRYSLVAWLINK